jgi:hypothetical protein
MKKLILILALSNAWILSAQRLGNFEPGNQPAAPDYALPQNWAAFPFVEDPTDQVPRNETPINDSLKQVDVFYIYPTVYLKGKTWNADVNNKGLNSRIDHYPVKYQAGVFNQVARVYAPRYRQAILPSFWDTTGNGEKALDFAYQDVKRAFEHYLRNHNHGRPIIIASHSQGTHHARRLLKDFFDIPQMKPKLVCAYIIGFGIKRKNYVTLTPCQNADEFNCYITWASFKEGYEPDAKSPLFGDVCINPVSWKTDTLVQEENGGILLNIHKKKPFKTRVRIKNNYLWVKTNTNFFSGVKNLHILDYNLFWHEIRRNVAQRVAAYLGQNQ